MPIDPVVAITEKLLQAERALRDARLRRDEKMTSRWLELVALLNEELYNAVPTSALGAAELLRRAAHSIGDPGASYANHMREIADRFADGTRALTDLVWLRSIRPALTGGLCGNDGIIVAPLIALAIKGASRPVVIFRAVLPSPRDGGWKQAHTGAP